MPEEQPILNVYAKRRELGDPATDPAAAERILEYLKEMNRRTDASAHHDVEWNRLFTEPTIAANLGAAKSYEEVISTNMEAQMEAAGKRRWGSHDHKHLYDLPRIFSEFPDARVVFCVRNVLDFLVSYLDKSSRMLRANINPDEAKRLQMLYHPVVTSLLWKSNVQAAGAAFERWSEQIILNRYEDMVADPQQQVRILCDFLGEDFEHSMLDPKFSNSAAVPWGERGEVAGIVGSSVGRWREKLTDSEAFVAQTICGKTLKQMEYAPEPVRPNVLAVCRIILSAPICAIRAIAANRPTTEPLLSYLVKRIRPLLQG
jgi:hypothetical protein